MYASTCFAQALPARMTGSQGSEYLNAVLPTILLCKVYKQPDSSCSVKPLSIGYCDYSVCESEHLFCKLRSIAFTVRDFRGEEQKNCDFVNIYYL